MLEKILEEIIEQLKAEGCIIDNDAGHRAVDIIRKHTNDGWIPVEERLPDNRRSNYEVTFINECGYEEHGFSKCNVLYRKGKRHCRRNHPQAHGK